MRVELGTHIESQGYTVVWFRPCCCWGWKQKLLRFIFKRCLRYRFIDHGFWGFGIVTDEKPNQGEGV